MIGALVAALLRLAKRDQRLEKIALIWGSNRVDEALDAAAELGKYGLTADDLPALTQGRAYLDLAGLTPRPGQGYVSWSLEHGLTTPKQWAEAERLDLLGMRDDPDDQP